jgi:hypothetical protein
MNNDTLIKVKKILRYHEEIFFAVKDLYKIRLLNHELPPLDELVRELKSQPDLVVTQNLRTGEQSDPVVMLRERIPTLEGIISRVRASLAGTLENLNKAYAAGIGTMAPEEEDLLLEALQRTKKLGSEMERMFADARERQKKTDTAGTNGHDS